MLGDRGEYVTIWTTSRPSASKLFRFLTRHAWIEAQLAVFHARPILSLLCFDRPGAEDAPVAQETITMLTIFQRRAWRSQRSSRLDARVETFPPREITVWLCLDRPCSSPRVEALVVETIKRGKFTWTKRQVRLRFLEPCPYDFFKAAIEGFSRDLHLPGP
jgi:hypothetical protein